MAMLLCSIVIGSQQQQPAPAPPAALLSISQVMTPEELEVTGVGKLSTAQRTALDSWLNRYTLAILKVATDPKQGEYPGLGGGHWIRKVGSGGEILTLEDGSLWEIQPIDRIYTLLWLPISKIVVRNAATPIGEYKYELVNVDDSEKALAKYLGKS